MISIIWKSKDGLWYHGRSNGRSTKVEEFVWVSGPHNTRVIAEYAHAGDPPQNMWVADNPSNNGLYDQLYTRACVEGKRAPKTRSINYY